MLIDDFGQQGLGLKAASDMKVMSSSCHIHASNLSFLVTWGKYPHGKKMSIYPWNMKQYSDKHDMAKSINWESPVF